MKLANWNIEAITGYTPKTTFYTDLSIADHFGVDAIEDTYRRVMEEWKDNVEYITEFIMALNWKIQEHYHKKNGAYATLYNNLWLKADEWAKDDLKGDDLDYYYNTTD